MSPTEDDVLVFQRWDMYGYVFFCVTLHCILPSGCFSSVFQFVQKFSNELTLFGGSPHKKHTHTQSDMRYPNGKLTVRHFAPEKWWERKTIRLPIGTLCNFSGACQLLGSGSRVNILNFHG